tara:strand:+ start:453 stop:788 length:336 start_codon:yes stop_codon:yes gene_type:complete
VLHYLYVFFKQNLTTPKIKDLVTKPNEEYKKIYSTIKKTNTSINVNNDDDKEKRKNELKKYMKSLSSKKTDDIKLKNNENTIESYNENTIKSYNGNTIESYNGSDDFFATF